MSLQAEVVFCFKTSFWRPPGPPACEQKEGFVVFSRKNLKTMIFWGQNVMQIKNYAVVNFSFTLRGRHLGFQDGRQSRHIFANYSKTITDIKKISAAIPMFSGASYPMEVGRIRKNGGHIGFQDGRAVGCQWDYS